MAPILKYIVKYYFIFKVRCKVTARNVGKQDDNSSKVKMKNTLLFLGNNESENHIILEKSKLSLEKVPYRLREKWFKVFKNWEVFFLNVTSTVIIVIY